MFLQFASFVFGVIIAFLIGFFETSLLKLKIEKYDKILLSFGMGNATVVFTLFAMNQYLGVQLSRENMLISVFSLLMILFIPCLFLKINYTLKQIKKLFSFEMDKVNKTKKIFLIVVLIFSDNFSSDIAFSDGLASVK